MFGGSFNPAHGGHLYVSLTALRRLKLDYVWWLVSPGNPLKTASATMDFAKRFASAQKLARHPRLIVSDIERQLGTRYTIDTVKALLRRFPGVQFVWLMGSDNLENFHLWCDWQKLARLLPMAVVQRPWVTSWRPSMPCRSAIMMRGGLRVWFDCRLRPPC